MGWGEQHGPPPQRPTPSQDDFDQGMAAAKEEIREMLVAELRKSGNRYEAAKAVVANPYSTHEALQEMKEAWGYRCGIAKAIETVDAFDAETVDAFDA